ncbi:hypothetical protein F441_13450 [Phytophthora nicotianae CJ01A1]|uniref:Cystatin domain-containing protein n=6 Tax=Phytophthora nicotianae TaxID=4792 RepID=W2R540_PHYN3|nr:hypothetical protein PPTG_03490 [Phytophthora nicotianae INRA-310]ETI41241.1 hypothetical protein F443_13518 [Phytophthora nicotianae P1569]ETL87973.1 hypothetical protein L917_12915 [Phytophthora nicotianae]ETP11007.1 hypothetical protein F441_13451 [Phytophthora nicotianae CJ01A1]ETN20498.1 hypothetical protein PPTG_03490 [Phytophthora nicotianae INRA-310]ETP11013.1 hypothetical protein F441_13450 [Phytophthora nicotianae CJ01A1]
MKESHVFTRAILVFISQFSSRRPTTSNDTLPDYIAITMVFLRSILTLLTGTALVVTSAQPFLPGAFNEKEITEEDMEMFNQAFERSNLSCDPKVDKLETQVVAGTNYKFTVLCQCGTNCEPDKYEFTIYKPLDQSLVQTVTYERVQ